MTALPSKFAVLYEGLSTKQNVRKRRVQFGDGYTQVTFQNINPLIVEARLKFIIKGDDDLNEFIQFFVDLGASPLTFTLPNDADPTEFDVTDISVDYIDAQFRRVNVSAIKRFGGSIGA